jgi:hypothetical protein
MALHQKQIYKLNVEEEMFKNFHSLALIHWQIRAGIYW